VFFLHSGEKLSREIPPLAGKYMSSIAQCNGAHGLSYRDHLLDSIKYQNKIYLIKTNISYSGKKRIFSDD